MLVTKGMPRGHLTAIIVSTPILAALYIGVKMTSAGGWAHWIALPALIALLTLQPILAQFAKLRASAAALTERHVTLETPLEPDAVFAKLATLSFGKVKPHDADAGRRVVVFTSPLSGFSYGCFFPVFVRGAGVGSIVEVGVAPKSIDTNKSLQKALEACAAEIKKAIAA
jgi:hypothetical protein